MPREMAKLSKEEQECLDAYHGFQRVRHLSKEIPGCVFDYELHLPEPPKDPTSIANYGKDIHERKFPYHDIAYVRKIDKMDPEDPEREEYIDTMDHRRYNGFWWYNKDKLEWINGHYYMTLQYWLIPLEDLDGRNGQPKFVDMIRDRNLVVWAGKNNKKCSGLAYIGCRRSSKTVDGTALGYWDTTEKYNAIFGIQSKTEKDGKKIMKKLQKSWKRLPSFLKPKDTGLTKSVSKLEFSNPQKRTSKGDEKEYEEVLDSEIEVYSADEHAMDGDRYTWQLEDEYGKRKKNDAALTQRVTSVSLKVGSKIVGFAYWATTVEEMDKQGGRAALTIMNASSIETTNKNGRTESGMWRLFFPAEYGLFEGETEGDEEPVSFVDEWGYSDMAAAKRWIDNEADGRTGEALLDWKRKYPHELEDAFVIREGSNDYDQHKLYEQNKYNAQLPPEFVERGNFSWEGGIPDTAVKWTPTPEGRWLVAWHPPEDDRNRWKVRNQQKWPSRDYCVMGVDPFSHRATVEEGSKAAGITYLKKHHLEPKMKKSFVCHYLYRQHHPHKMHEDMLMQAVYYSSPMLCEDNKYGVLDHFAKRGYDGFCMYNPFDKNGIAERAKGRRGINMSNTDHRELLMNTTQAYINDYIGQRNDGSFGFCPFDDIIQDWRLFDPNNWTPYDSAVAAGLCFIAEHKVIQVVKRKFTSRDWLPDNDNRGRSTVVRKNTQQ